MLKVMLVEDEILVRVGIKSIVDWETYGYTVIGEASNGAEALEKIQADPPDIVLTDLVMDGMNGFELITALRKAYPAIRIIVLSCHNDFQNVKEAMRLGASDYIFKLTVKPEELIRTLDAVKEQAGMSAQPDSAPGADRIVHQNMGAIKSKLVHAAIERSYASAEECGRELKQLRMKTDVERDYVLLVVSADVYDLANVNSRIKERELLKFSMLNFTAETFERYGSAEVLDAEGGDCLVLVNTEGLAAAELTGSLTESLETLQAYMRRYLGLSVTGAVGAVHQGIRELPLAYQEAAAALENRFFSGGGGIHVYRESPARQGGGSLELPEHLAGAVLERHLELLDEDKIKTFLGEFFDFLMTCRHVSRHRVRNRLLDIVFPFLAAARRRGVDLDDIRLDDSVTPQQAIAKFTSLPQIREWFLRFADAFASECRRRGTSRSREDIAKVRDYVQDHLGEEINIASAAALVNMSESYFSHLFKKETGSSFVDYVNTARVEKAKALLLQTPLKIYEVASQVGFENPNYFSLLFKKMTGRSPNDYRR